MQAPWQLSKHRSGGREQPQELGDLGEEGEGQACSTELRVRALEMPSQAVPSPAPPTRCVAGPGGPGDTAEEEAQPLPSWGTLSPPRCLVKAVHGT